MTEQTPETPSRAWIKYDPAEDTGPVSLPGYLSAIPGIVSPGDVFSIDGAFLDEVVIDGESSRFSHVEEPRQESTSPNASLTKAQLAEKLNRDLDENDEDYVDAGAYAKADLVALADAYDLTHPTPPSDQDEDTPDDAGEADPA